MSSTNLFQRIFLFASMFLGITLQAFSQDNELEKLLRLDLEGLKDITVISATKTLIGINEVPATVKVITSESIKENGYLTLEDALSTLPGFQFRNILGFNSYIFQRGIPNQNNLALLLVDGIQINELNSGGFYAGGQFNLDNVQRIEVIYGPASALYGTNAISGVINIITKDPINNKGLSLSGLYGSFRTYNGNIAYGYYNEQEEFGIRIAGMIKSSQKADLAGSEGDNNWSSEMENFEDDYSLDLNSQYRNLKFGLNFMNKQSSRTTNYKTTGTNFLDENTLWNIRFINAHLNYSSSLSPDLDLVSTLYYRNATLLDNTIAYITNVSQVGYYRPSNLTGIESMLSYSASQEIKLVGGFLFERESLAEDFSITFSKSSTEKPPVPQTPQMLNNTLLSMYLQSQYKISESFNLYGGARLDHSSVYEDVITPRFGLVYNENKLTVKLLYSEAFRAPKPWDYTFGLGNENLESEKMSSFEIAAQYMIMEHFDVDLSIYKNHLSDLIIVETINNNSRSINSGDMGTMGMEVNFDYRKNPFRSFLNYTYNSSTDDNNALIPEIAKHTANFGITYHPSVDIGLTLRCNYLGGRVNTKVIKSTGSNYLDDAIVFHSSLFYTGLEKFRISLTVNNLLNAAYYHTSNRPPDRYRQPQRTVLAKVEFNL